MDKDIQEMFRKKNREILIKNLKLDIERNIDSEEESLSNMFNYQFDTCIRNISSMYDQSDVDKEVTKAIILLKTRLFFDLKNIIDKRKDVLLDFVDHLEFEEEEMKNYYDFVFETKNNVLSFLESDEVKELLNLCIASLDVINQKVFNEDLEKIVSSRIYDYIHIRLFGKLKTNILNEFLIRDNNLSNKGRESYEKFQELESRTSCC